MNSDVCQHLLTIKNLKNNESISYSLLLIKGSIETVNRNQKCNQNVLSISLNNKSYTSDIQQKQFKTLVHLNRGNNVIIFQFCNVVERFNITWEPRNTPHRIVPLYIVIKGHNGNFQSFNDDNTPAIACEKIYTAARIIQSFYAEKLNETYERKTFQLESDLDINFPKCYLFNSQFNVEQIKRMSQEEIWTGIAREIMTSSIGSAKRKYLGFLSSTWYNGDRYKTTKTRHEDIVGITDGYVALGGGGLALFGSACLYCWPRNPDEINQCFGDQTKIDPLKLMDDSCYRGTFGGCFATTLGSVCHELGHTFDLGHSKHGLMGRGFDNINRVFVLTAPKCQENFKANHKVVVSDHESVQSKVVRNDLTVISPNCATILHYHKWFNTNTDNSPGVINFDNSTKEINATYGLQIVEIRTVDTELVVDWWKFSDKSLIKKFVIPVGSREQIIFAQDSHGNIFKTVSNSK